MPNPTRPTGEQLLFRSRFTGDHILDDYLEAAQHGGRTLADLLDDLFDGNGNFVRGSGFYNWLGNYVPGVTYAQGDTFRDPATLNLYVALRPFIAPASVATPLASGNVGLVLDATILKSYQDAALASKNAAATSEANALASKNAAATSATTATTKAGEASTSASNALTSANNAAASATASQISADASEASRQANAAQSGVADTEPTPDTTVKRDANGDAKARYLQQTGAAQAAATSWLPVMKQDTTPLLASVTQASWKTWFNALTGIIAAAAIKLNTARSISLSGGATGTVNFDGSSNVTIPTTITNNSHTHTIANVTDLDNQLAGKLAVGATAASANVATTADRLTTARTISLTGNATGSVVFDGSGNAAISTTVNDSAKLGGQLPAYYQRDVENVSFLELGRQGTGDRAFFLDFHAYGTPSQYDYSARIIRNAGPNGTFDLVSNGSGDLTFNAGSGRTVSKTNFYVENTSPALRVSETDTNTFGNFALSGGALYIQAGANNAGETVSSGTIYITGWGNSDVANVYIKDNGVNNKVWHAGNDGAGSGLDAALLDGKNASADNDNNTVAVRTASGDVVARLFRSEFTSVAGSANYLMAQVAAGGVNTDNYLRPVAFSNIANQLAGAGLSRNGDTLQVNPTSITSTSTNSSTSVGHTHYINSTTIRELIAQSSVGALGTYAFLSYLSNGATRGPGYSRPGSDLTYASANNTTRGGSPAGTWELQGYIVAGDSGDKTSVWLRVA